ncbi:MAG: Lrp/AsnC family transcriptional regulator [Chloroflexi bacterium]|nr:Lrp/AsnC family transcriptional regulator [Chloroflexota bacterium]
MEEILRALERDGRLTPAEIANETGRHEDEVRALVSEAEARHVVVGYGARINWEAAGRPQVHALVEVKVQPEENVGYGAVAARVSRFDNVISCYLTSGSYDLAVIVRGQSIHEVSDFVGEKLATMHGIQSTVTHVIMRRYKENDVLLRSTEEVDRQLVMP